MNNNGQTSQFSPTDYQKGKGSTLNIYSVTDVSFTPTARTLNSTYEGLDITVKIAHGFPFDGGSGDYPAYFTNIPTLIVNSLGLNLSGEVDTIGNFGGGFPVYYDGTNWVFGCDYCYVTAQYIVIKRVYKRLAGSYALTPGDMSFRAFLLAPELEEQDSSTASWSGTGHTVYYSNWTFDVDGNLTDSAESTYTMANADFYIFGSPNFVGKYG